MVRREGTKQRRMRRKNEVVWTVLNSSRQRIFSVAYVNLTRTKFRQISAALMLVKTSKREGMEEDGGESERRREAKRSDFEFFHSSR
jgi:hypothetical protein